MDAFNLSSQGVDFTLRKNVHLPLPKNVDSKLLVKLLCRYVWVLQYQAQNLFRSYCIPMLPNGSIHHKLILPILRCRLACSLHLTSHNNHPSCPTSYALSMFDFAKFSPCICQNILLQLTIRSIRNCHFYIFAQNRVYILLLHFITVA